MRVLTTVAELRAAVGQYRAERLTIGFVPTMGSLHDGHLALVARAKGRADRSVVSIFVNPLQFGAQEDLGRYPRDLARDCLILDQAGVDLVFAPSNQEMFPEPVVVRVDPGPQATRWEGAARPGHFGGVLTVVAKLFHQVTPDLVCFGQKDIQQVSLVRRMVKDLDWPIEVIVVPTVRDPDGLALSSRNLFLAEADRVMARRLSRALTAVEASWRAGVTDVEALRGVAAAVFAESPAIAADYIAVVDSDRFESVAVAGRGTVVAVAARIGPTRLIDNLLLGA